ncbi:RING-type domain-containing protein [Balamuthia mandrillaris]
MQKPTLACSAISREKGAPWYKTGSLSPRHWLRRPRSVSAPKSSTGSPSSSPRPREEDRLTKKQKKQQKKSRKQRRKQLQAHERKRQKAQAQAESDSKAVQLARSLSWTLLNAVKETRDKIAAPLDEEEEDLAFSIDSLSWSSSSNSSLSYSSSEEELSPSASPRLADSAAQLRLQAALAASKTNSLPSRSWRRLPEPKRRHQQCRRRRTSRKSNEIVMVEAAEN